MIENIPFISFICCILSRLSYFKNNKFLNKYNNIFNNNIISNHLLKNIASTKLNNIFNLKNIPIKDYATKINKIMNNHRRDIKTSNNMKYISISTSNYSSIYIVADKNMNSIFVIFRGTSSIKSMTSYFKLSSLKPHHICNSCKAGFNLGIYKITCEVINTIMESIYYLVHDFLKSTKENRVKIFSTGHSLGVMSMIFSYNYIGMMNNKKSIYSSKKYSILDNKICCITFGAPRVMNVYSKRIFNIMIKNKYIYFKRIVALNDIFIDMPLTTRLFSSSYYHPNENKVGNNNISLKNTKIVNNDNKQSLEYYIKKYKLSSHGVYLYITFADYSFLNPFQEIRRYNLQKKCYSKINEGGHTVCRLIIGGNNIPFKVVFFLLDDAKYQLDETFKKKKGYLPNIDDQDINITTKTFNHLLNHSCEMTDSLNPLKGHIMKLLKDKNKKDNINCLTCDYEIL